MKKLDSNNITFIFKVRTKFNCLRSVISGRSTAVRRSLAYVTGFHASNLQYSTFCMHSYHHDHTVDASCEKLQWLINKLSWVNLGL
jgi:hypothetical protein